ncbi:MAG: hypothetical protein ONB27_11150, partial [candidate division KSB1 bacterium]|nr:hypothetical protein [candidate division KSB1 bacterium]
MEKLITDSPQKTIVARKQMVNDSPVTLSSSDNQPTYSVDICRQLQQLVEQAQLLRYYPPTRFEAGDTLELHLVGVCPDVKLEAAFQIEKFVGGGFAGQVYRVRLLQLDDATAANQLGLRIGNVYAMKILVPPSGFSIWFRNFIYWLAYQGPFSAQVHFAAARVGVLWQKLIRRGAKICFGTEKSIVDTYATFYCEQFRSYGEINEWVAGRTWKFEIDDQIFKRRHSKKLSAIPEDGSINSAEYLAKRKFMANLVQLLHDIGAPELARQYEWGTMKSQPNVLKRLDSGDEQVNDLTAIDFRAGLALLPFLPMSP